MIRITVLSDNNSMNPSFEAEHGLSLLIESRGRKILFDTGASDLYLRNAERLGIDIATVDTLVISHGHYDHTGGVDDFLRLNAAAPILMSRHALEQKRKGDKNISCRFDAASASGRIRFVEGNVCLADDIRLSVAVALSNESAMKVTGFQTYRDGEYVQDVFEDEITVSLLSAESHVVVSACSHRGFSNAIAASAQLFGRRVSHFVGGMHLKDSPVTEVMTAARHLADLRVDKIYALHCTGYENYSMMKNVLNARITYAYAGECVVIG